MRTSIKLALLFVLAGFTGAAFAQSNNSSSTTPPEKHYKVDFVVKEVDASGRTTNNRGYSMTLSTRPGPRDTIRGEDGFHMRVKNTTDKGEVQYFNEVVPLGVNIDAFDVHEVDQKLASHVTVEVKSLPFGNDPNSTEDAQLPLERHFQWSSDILVTPGVPTTVFSSDDLDSKNKMQVEVTATLIK